MNFKIKIGNIDIKEEEIITFELGIPGFEKLKKFYLYEDKNTEPISWLCSLEDSQIAFPIIDIYIVRVDYDIFIQEDIIEYLEITKPEDIKMYGILSIPENGEATINLVAPLIVSKSNKKALQFIVDNSEYKTKHLLKEEIERTSKIIIAKKAE